VEYVTLDRLVVLRDAKVKVKKGEWYSYAEIGDIDVTTGAINFRRLRGYQLPTSSPSLVEKGDVLVSTVRTYRKGIGYVSSDKPNLVSTNAVMNIGGTTDEVPGLSVLYLLAFLRTDFFVEQVWSMLNRGVYPRMDKGALNKICIPIPSDTRVIRYVESLMQAILEKEQLIRQRDVDIKCLTDEELEIGQNTISPFTYAHPTIEQLKTTTRLDTGLYREAYKEKLHRISNYDHRAVTFDELGFRLSRGQNLQVSCIGKSIYSDTPKPNFYRLALPTDFSEYGTISKYKWLGNSRKLRTLQEGDIVFGAEGTFRVVVFSGAPERTITNIHGIVLRSDKAGMVKRVFAGTWLRYISQWGLIDDIAVGGHGGSMAQSYWHNILVPKFPEEKQEEIAKLYHNPAPKPTTIPTLDGFVEWHRWWNKELGIWELDSGMKALQSTLEAVQEQIINDEKVIIPFDRE